MRPRSCSQLSMQKRSKSRHPSLPLCYHPTNKCFDRNASNHSIESDYFNAPPVIDPDSPETSPALVLPSLEDKKRVSRRVEAMRGTILRNIELCSETEFRVEIANKNLNQVLRTLTCYWFHFFYIVGLTKISNANLNSVCWDRTLI